MRARQDIGEPRRQLTHMGLRGFWPASIPRKGTVWGQAACRLDGAPQSVGSSCHTREHPNVPLKFFTLLLRGYLGLEAAERSQLLGRSATQSRMA